MKLHIKRLAALAFVCVMALSLFAGTATVSAEEAEIDTSKIRDVYMPQTCIVNPPTVVQYINTAEKLEKLQGGVRPQAAWFVLTSEGKAKLGDETVSLGDALNACAGKVIPVLEIPDMACAEIVSEEVKNQYFDLLLASSDTAVLKKLYEDAIGYTRLVYITDLTDPQTIVETALSNGAMIVAMKNPNRETCEYMQQRFLTVLSNPDLESDELNVRSAVDCGANFILLDGFQTAYDMYASVTEQSFVRRAYVVGHRGMVTYAPDNTAEGVYQAFESGADAAEIDIRYTADKQIICFHNNDLSGATLQKLDDPSKPISEYTLEELKQYNLMYSSGHIYKNAKIPTLEEILAVLQQYPDKMLVIEFKDFLVEPTHLLSVLEEYDVVDQCVFIGFGQSVLNRYYPTIPVIGASDLDGSYPKENAAGCVDRYYSITVGSVCSYSPSYTIPDDTIAMLHCRGVSVNLWTAGSFSVMEEMAKRGAQFITTDRVEDHEYVHNLYENMGAEQLFANYKNASAIQPESPEQQATVVESGFDPLAILPWFFALPCLAFVAAIIIKIYNVRKK